MFLLMNSDRIGAGRVTIDTEGVHADDVGVEGTPAVILSLGVVGSLLYAVYKRYQ